MHRESSLFIHKITLK